MVKQTQWHYISPGPTQGFQNSPSFTFLSFALHPHQRSGAMWTRLSLAVVVVTMLIGCTLGKGLTIIFLQFSKYRIVTLSFLWNYGKIGNLKGCPLCSDTESMNEGPMYRVFYIFIDDNPVPCLIQEIPKIFISCGLAT